MKIVNKPEREKWADLMRRPVIEQGSLSKTVRNIIKTVAQEGDAALFGFARQSL